jgi:hypothetical protein
MVAIGALLVFSFLRPHLDRSVHAGSSITRRAKTAVFLILLPFIFYFFINVSFAEISANNFANELSANGIYNFFAAFRNNQIPYETSYPVRKNQEVFCQLKTLLQEKTVLPPRMTCLILPGRLPMKAVKKSSMSLS